VPKTLVSEVPIATSGVPSEYAPVLRRMSNFGLPKAVVTDASRQLVCWGAAFFDTLHRKLSAPSVFATPDGIIVFEWESGQKSLEVFLNSKDRVRYVLIRSEDEEEDVVAPDEIPQKLAQVFGS
jgi:hypothetical protein